MLSNESLYFATMQSIVDASVPVYKFAFNRRARDGPAGGD